VSAGKEKPEQIMKYSRI